MWVNECYHMQFMRNIIVQMIKFPFFKVVVMRYKRFCFKLLALRTSRESCQLYVITIFATCQKFMDTYKYQFLKLNWNHHNESQQSSNCRVSSIILSTKITCVFIIHYLPLQTDLSFNICPLQFHIHLFLLVFVLYL